MTRRPLLAATDFSAGADLALEHAGALARELGSPLAIVAVNSDLAAAVPFERAMIPDFDPLEVGRILHDATRSALEERAELLGLFDLEPDFHVRTGETAQQIAILAAELDAEWTVVGRSGRGRVEQALLGGTAERLMRTCATPVMLVGDDVAPRARSVLVALDFGPCTAAQLRHLRRLPLAEHAEIQLVAIGDLPDSVLSAIPSHQVRTDLMARTAEFLSLRLDEVADSLSDLPARVFRFVREGEAWERILAVAHDHGADTLVIGSVGRRGLSRLLVGNTAEKVARRFPRRTIVVPADRSQPLAAPAAQAPQDPR